MTEKRQILSFGGVSEVALSLVKARLMSDLLLEVVVLATARFCQSLANR